jgi:hypothetical protein
LELVWEGRIQPILIWDKHPAVVGVVGFGLALMLLLLNRLLFGRRRRMVPAA